MMIDLDNPEVYKRLDRDGMRERIRELPQQCLKAWQQALSFKLPRSYSNIDRVVILGMGGSAIGGDLLNSLASLESKTPISVSRDYNLPQFVDSKTLVIASSYSGMTEETLSAFDQALATPAKKLVITTGGKLKTIAEQNKIPVLTIDYKAPPRAALAHSFVPLLGICQNLGIVSDKSKDVAEMAQVLQDLQKTIDENCPLQSNPAKQLATKLHSHLAIIYGAGFVATAAQRWKTQINENSKAWAFYEIFPELNHNAVVGYEFPADLAQKLFVVFLRSPRLHPRTLIRYKLTAEMLSNAKVSHETVEARGESALSQMMSLVFFGDWVSYYLALLNETDPYPVKIIDFLKKRLAES
jgi:glucose/mannose-6-phosphate isomerase